MILKVIKTIEDYNMIRPGDTVITALSGGADSVSLLYTLFSLKDRLGFELKAAHMNHNIRGEEAVRDEEFCKKICSNLGIEIFVKSVKIKDIAEKNKISLESAGRNERYAFFDEISKHYKNSKIATAHTASDNLETVLFNLVRGCGVDGLCGIPVCRGNIIRPLINVTRDEIEEFCLKNGISYVTDSTNNELVYTRNKIRNIVVPALKEINPAAERAVSRMSGGLSEISAYLSGQAMQCIEFCRTNGGYSCEKLLMSEKILREKMIFLIAKNAGINNLEKKHIDLCENILYNGGAVDLPGNFRAVVRQGIFRITTAEKDSLFEKLCLKSNTKIDFDDKRYIFSFITAAPDTSENNIIPIGSGDIILRIRHGGDVFRPHGRKVTKTIKKLFNELKIPAERRDKLLLVEQDGKILWIEDIGLSDDVNIKNAVLFLKITIIHHIQSLK